MATSSRRKQLTAHLEAAFAEIQRLSAHFGTAIERLEAATQANLTVDGAAAWFRMYLRLVDLGVLLRRGEQRHRSAVDLKYQSMHSTGAKGARHTGLGIDDANAIYQLLETTPGVKESQLEVYFMRMDSLDRDGVGLLDARLNACLANFLRQRSAFYTRVDVGGSDPHQELTISHTNHATKISRQCFAAVGCTCLPDAEPWVDFVLTPGASQVSSQTIDVFPSSAVDATTEVGLAELKRQYGFEALMNDDSGEQDYELDPVAAVAKRRRVSTETGSARPPQPPRDIYRRKCQERGLPRKRKLEELLVVRSGALDLDLSQFGFHAAQDLRDLVDVVLEAQVPVRLLDVTNNFFDAASFEILCELLRQPLVRGHVTSLRLRCLALPQRGDFAVLLRLLTATDGGGEALVQLTNLDLSYNTFFEDAVLSFNDLLDGLPSLAQLSLESCFPKAPDPSVVEVAVVKDLVRHALVACCHRLQRLHFGSNWMSFPLLNALFSPESALQELVLPQMTFFFLDDQQPSPQQELPISWRFTFQRQQTLTLSETRHSRGEFLPFFLDALTYCLKMQLAALEHLDLTVLAPRKADTLLSTTAQAMGADAAQLPDRVLALVHAAADFGSLRSLRLRCELDHALDPLRAVSALAQLLSRGLAQCESLEMALSLPISIRHLSELLAQTQAPLLKTLKLTVALLPSQEHGDFATVFAGALRRLTSLTLECQVPVKDSASRLPDAAVQELERAWRQADAASKKRSVSLVKRKPRREHQDESMVTFAFLFTAP